MTELQKRYEKAGFHNMVKGLFESEYTKLRHLGYSDEQIDSIMDVSLKFIIKNVKKNCSHTK